LPEAHMRTPKLVQGRGDLRSASLSPTDGFVLSRIDGTSDEQEIVEATGLAIEAVQACLAKLASLGIIDFDGAPSPKLAPSPQAPVAPPRQLQHEKGPAPVAEGVDLDAETKRLVTETHLGLERSDHYALLGVDRHADKKTLKRAYFDLAAKFHPDRYFRKHLGTYKFRMEAIFGRLTLAYDALSNAESRAEYDEYLAEQRRARSIEELLAEALAETKRAEESIERQVRAHTPLPVPSSSSIPPSRSPSSAGAGTASVSGSTPVAATPTPGPTVDVSARRDALARRLLGGRNPASSSSAPPPRISLPPTTPNVADAMEALRRRYEERLTRAKTTQARKYVEDGEAALAKGDSIAAANAFRVAASLSPADVDVERLAREAQAKADAVLSEAYVRQAAYEEKTNQWVEAGRSWSRVCKANPNDARAHERASNALVKSGGDLHEAERLAEHACALQPREARYRVALANVYQAAGLALNARRELDAAAQLAPHDDSIKGMIGRMGGGR
jgi:tetratricopeptide (TPR) repeat protein